MIRKLVLLSCLITGCANPIFPASNVYLSVRIVNNELGRLLKQYHTTSLELAQHEVDSEAIRDCQPNDSPCRTGVKNRIAQKYTDRENRYNTVATIQRETARLITFADNTCATLTEDLCETAKNDVISNKREIEKAWNEVSSWVQ